MKELLAVISLVLSGAVCEAPAPYPPSGWRPQGPTLELPERTPVDPRNKVPQKQYLTPEATSTPSQEYGPPEVDVSVQGLPTEEQLPIFQLSPVNGQQYAGPNFNHDLRNFEQNLRDAQLQAQQNFYRELARQRQLEAALSNANTNRVPSPRQFVPRTTTTTPKPEFSTTPETTTQSLNLGEVEDKKDKVSVEVSKQNIQEYHPELFLAPLAQLQLQNQYSPVQLGQLRAPIYLEPTQKVIDSQLLAQQYLQLQQQLVANQPQVVQTQQSPTQVPTYLAPEKQQQNQYEYVQPVQTFPQQVYLQPQPNQLLPRTQDQSNDEQQTQPQPQFVYQYQPEYQQPIQPAQQPNQFAQQPNQLAQQPNQLPQQPNQFAQQPNQFAQQPNQLAQQPNQFYQQPQNSYELPQYYVQDPLYQQQVAQIAQQQIFQQQLAQQQQQLAQQQLAQQQFAQQQGQGSLQSGLDVNQQGNGIDQQGDKEGDGQDDGSTATAVATAFGTRTQPRVYGAPVPVPRVQANPGYSYQTTTENQDETTDAPTVAEATAVARGDKRRPAKLRARQGRVRPIFTLDKSGHLVLAQEQ